MQFLTEHINAEYDRTQHDNSGAIHPSSLNECHRQAVYQYLGYEKDVEHSDFLKKVFFHGHRIEEWMNQALRAKGILIARSVPVRAEVDGIAVEGEIDHIISCNITSSEGDFYSNRGWCIADTKSLHDGAFNYADLPYHHHVLQVGAYRWALRQMLKTKRSAKQWLAYLEKTRAANYDANASLAVALARIQTGTPPQEYPPVLFYVGRGNLHEETVSTGDVATDWALQKLSEITECINAEIIPDRPFCTPNEHRYLCARTVSKGSRVKKDGTRTKPPVYVPSCEYFKACWGVLPAKWSFWSEVVSS